MRAVSVMFHANVDPALEETHNKVNWYYDKENSALLGVTWGSVHGPSLGTEAPNMTPKGLYKSFSFDGSAKMTTQDCCL